MTTHPPAHADLTAAPMKSNGQRSAHIDLAAIHDNVATLKSIAGAAKLMAVLKADAYGHGLLPVARAALGAGADYLGVAVLEEAFELRRAGIQGPVFAWLCSPGAPYARAVAEEIELAAYGVDQLVEIVQAARQAGGAARIHLKIDTGMWRGGASEHQWPALCIAAREAETAGFIRVVGIFSHLACADEPGHASIDMQLMAFRRAVAVARDHGVVPELCHIANSAATLSRPDSHFDMVRPGLAVYGVNPLPASARTAAMALRPAMTLSATVAHVKPAPEGAAVSYGGTECTSRATQLAIVPLGYADGVPRSASSRGPVHIGLRRYRVLGRVCMDQFIVDVGEDPVLPGARAVLFGPGDRGEPRVDDWAEAAGTIPYEVLTGIGSRVPRSYSDVRSGT